MVTARAAIDRGLAAEQNAAAIAPPSAPRNAAWLFR